MLFHASLLLSRRVTLWFRGLISKTFITKEAADMLKGITGLGSYSRWFEVIYGWNRIITDDLCERALKDIIHLNLFSDFLKTQHGWDQFSDLTNKSERQEPFGFSSRHETFTQTERRSMCLDSSSERNKSFVLRLPWMIAPSELVWQHLHSALHEWSCSCCEGNRTKLSISSRKKPPPLTFYVTSYEAGMCSKPRSFSLHLPLRAEELFHPRCDYFMLASARLIESYLDGFQQRREIWMHVMEILKLCIAWSLSCNMNFHKGHTLLYRRMQLYWNVWC